MRRTASRIALACAAVAGLSGPALAQAPQANVNAQQPKERKHPNQVPETGPNAPAPDPDGRFDRVIDAVQVTVRADGTIVAELDESFMEASTATIEADGSFRFDHYTGLERAAEAVRRELREGPRPLAARTLPLAFPILEDKE